MDLEIGEDCSFERLMKMLKAFTARSQNSMRSVVIDKLMEGKVKLEMIFDVVHSLIFEYQNPFDTAKGQVEQSN